MHYGSGSVVPSRSAGFTNTGSPRPARPGQLDQMMADNIAGGADPAEINEMCHASAAALLDRVHHTQDAELVERVLTLVDREGVDVIAELWSHADPDSLPGILWRLYLLRQRQRRRCRLRGVRGARCGGAPSAVCAVAGWCPAVWIRCRCRGFRVGGGGSAQIRIRTAITSTRPTPEVYILALSCPKSQYNFVPLPTSRQNRYEGTFRVSSHGGFNRQI